MKGIISEAKNTIIKCLKLIITSSACLMINSLSGFGQNDYERNFFFNSQLSIIQKSINFNSVLTSAPKIIETDFNIGYKKVGFLFGRRYNSFSANLDSLLFVEGEDYKYFSTNLAINYLIFDFRKRFNIQLTGGINVADRPFNFQTDYFFSTMLSARLGEIFMEFPNRTLLLTFSGSLTHLVSSNFYSSNNTLNSVYFSLNIGFSSLILK